MQPITARMTPAQPGARAQQCAITKTFGVQTSEVLFVFDPKADPILHLGPVSDRINNAISNVRSGLAPHLSPICASLAPACDTACCRATSPRMRLCHLGSSVSPACNRQAAAHPACLQPRQRRPGSGYKRAPRCRRCSTSSERGRCPARARLPTAPAPPGPSQRRRGPASPRRPAPRQQRPRLPQPVPPLRRLLQRHPLCSRLRPRQPRPRGPGHPARRWGR